ncbi:hypothetical protein [Providencia hangzhouensis]|uniref:hypothetical protein n=1 Tax=Providencia hangzhouensis TaxID=3031799 RepID=UPI003F4A8003
MNYVFDFIIKDESFLLQDTKYNNRLDSNLSFLPNGKKDIENFFIETKYSGSELVDEIKYDDFINGFFPEVNTHVFISHSHSDKNKAISLANFFYKKFGIRSFIDSEVWGYLDDALLELNKKYNPVDGKKNTYCYEDCMKLSSNLNLILSSALTKMIDSSDCMIFINTDKSCNVENDSFSTKSPWIFTEILMSSLLEHKGHKDRPLVVTNESYSGVEEAGFNKQAVLKAKTKLVIDYPLGMDHIVKVDDSVLNDINNLEPKYHYQNSILERLHIPSFSNKEIFQNLDMIYDTIHF